MRSLVRFMPTLVAVVLVAASCTGVTSTAPLRTPNPGVYASMEGHVEPAYNGPMNVNVTDAMLLNAAKTPQDWLTYGATLQDTRYSSLDQINTTNVSQLKPVYVFRYTEHGVSAQDEVGFETTPLVVNGIMYMTTPWDHVFALKAATGEVLWRYDQPMSKDLALCCDAVNRGVAVYGDKVYLATLDAKLVALDANTGKRLWEVQVGDPTKGYSETAAPVAYKGMIYLGISGDEYGIRGYVSAYDANNGKLVWQHYNVPAPGEPGSDTWGGHDSWMRGGGGSWQVPAIDPTTNTVYWAVDNPSPPVNAEVRPGANLYTDSMVATDADTGKMKWYFQYSPNDHFDYDAVSPAQLFDVQIGGKTVHAAGQAPKSGWYYVLDRDTGKPLHAPTEFVTHVGTSLSPTFQTVEPPQSATGVTICPGGGGGSEWPPVAYSEQTHLSYVSGINDCDKYTAHVWTYVAGRLYWGSSFVPLVGQSSGTFSAIDPATGDMKWQYKASEPMVAGSCATAGGLVFTSEQNGQIDGFDAANGKLLWKFQAQGGGHAAPMVFAVDGKEYLAIAMGDGGWTAGFGSVGVPHVAGGLINDTLYVFALPS